MLALVLFDRVDSADPGVVECRGRTRLPLEPLERGRVLRQLGGKKLDRNAASESHVFGFVDDTTLPRWPCRVRAQNYNEVQLCTGNGEWDRMTRSTQADDHRKEPRDSPTCPRHSRR